MCSKYMVQDMLDNQDQRYGSCNHLHYHHRPLNITTDSPLTVAQKGTLSKRAGLYRLQVSYFLFFCSTVQSEYQALLERLSEPD